MQVHFQMTHCELKANLKSHCFHIQRENNGFSDQELAESIGITC